MGKFIEDLSKLNWDFISGAFELGVKIAVPVLILIIKPWRVFFSNGIKAIKFVINLMNPKHELYYEGVLKKVNKLDDHHEEQNSNEVKKLQAKISEYEARDKAKEKEGFEKLQESFEKLEGNVENALESIIKQGAQIKRGEGNIIKIYKLIQQQKEDLLELKNNQNRKAA